MPQDDTFGSQPVSSGTSSQAGSHPGMHFVEFVAMMAALMALNALAMDTMLPALPDIGHALNIMNENDHQNVLIAYLIGFGGAQLFYGPVSDAFGRRHILLAGLALYALASVAALVSHTQDQLFFARFLQGVGCAATRVIATSVIRDCYSGRQMGRVMSLVMMVFMVVPVLAPSIGQAVILVADWRWIFTFLMGAGVIMLVWCWFRLPETLPKKRRQPLDLRAITHAYMTTLRTRSSLGYMFALTFVFGGLFSFLTMSQQIFVQVYGLGVWFPIVFASVAIAMAAASFTNSTLVEAIGMRRLSHGAIFVFITLGAILLALSLTGSVNFWLFILMTGVVMASFGFLGANFNAMAMEPLGQIAGTASSVIGSVSTLGGAVLGYIMGQLFNGTIMPLALAFTLYGLGALVAILYAEGGRLFHTYNA
ncbi:Bcr/CflA family efflux MFS transporter [Roseibium sp. RKSG952]|nr:Bcr/CflA family efflux MFS transporter [Roseibium sp. RKSG952]